MTGPPLAERDLAVLRSFARRIDPSDAGAHNNLGVLYYQKSLVPEAIAEFTRALELDPKMQVAQANLEIAYRSTGYYDRRVAELGERLRRTPGDREARWELARTYAALGHHDDAIREFEQVLERYPEDGPTLVQLGLALKASGRLEEASERFRVAHELDPRSSVALFYYGEALYNRGLPDQSLAALEEAVALNPDHADAHYLLAFLYGDLGQHDQARAATKRAISLNPTFARAQTNLSLRRRSGVSRIIEQSGELARPSLADSQTLAHYNLGLAFRQKGYYVEALREYRLALENGEDRRLALQAMAEVHLLRRDLSAALELYDSLTRDFPDSPKLHNERGVCLHQAGRRQEAEAAYRKAVELDRAYALAWNNLGVLLSHGAAGEAAIEAFQMALRPRREFVTANLNLGLHLLQRKRLQLALEAYRQVLEEHPNNAVAWNGVGLVLTELKRFPDARNAFARAVESDPDLASAHYNLSFTLSQLGEFDLALRETKRALELEPFYVPQKSSLAIDLQYEDPTISIVPDISGDVAADEVGGEFSFDERLLDQVFRELAPAAPAPPPAPPAGEDPLAMAREYLSKGMLERASLELERAVSRGAPTARAAVMSGQIFARRGLHGEALERFRAARHEQPGEPGAALGEVRALLALDRPAECAALSEELLTRQRTDVETLVAVARVRLGTGNPVGALDLVKEAQARAPGRPDLLQLQARIAARLGDVNGAVEAYQAALQLDGSLAQVWYELGLLEEKRENWTAARMSYDRALDILPTYVEAVLALADLLRRSES
ncbi:MAG: tetratricopeptide repeat protein, partial [Gemmatimonadales bacterium]